MKLKQSLIAVALALSLFACSFADNLFWRPRAAYVNQVETVTATLTWATADTAALTLNGATITVTGWATPTTAEVAESLAATINATDLTTGLIDGETRSAAGQNINQFKQVVATYSSGNSFTITTDDNYLGKPFTVSVVATTTGDGDLSTTTTTAATSPHHWDEIANWHNADGADKVPVSGDNVHVDQGGSDSGIWYALATGEKPNAVYVTRGFEGTIGRPPLDQDNPPYQYPIPEDEQYLQFDNSAGTTARIITIGQGKGNGSPMINVDWDALDNPLVQVVSTGDPDPPGGSQNEGLTQHAVNLDLATNAEISIAKGHVALCPQASRSMTIDSLRIGSSGESDSDTTVFIGKGASLADATTPAPLEVHSGNVRWQSDALKVDVRVWDGVLTAEQDVLDVTDAFTLIVGSQGEFISEAGINCTSVEVFPGGKFVHNFGNLNNAPTITNLTLHPDSSFIAPREYLTLTNGFKVPGGGIEDLKEFDRGQNYTVPEFTDF